MSRQHCVSPYLQCNMKSYQKHWAIILVLQLLGLGLHSSESAKEDWLPPQPQLFLERDVMLQRWRKAPAPSSSTACTRDGAPVRLAVEVVVMITELPLMPLQSWCCSIYILPICLFSFVVERKERR